MEFKQFLNSAFFPIAGIAFFCAGYAAFISTLFLLAAFISIFATIAIVSYLIKHPIGGLIFGLYVAIAFLLGLLFFAITEYINGFDIHILFQYFSLPPSGKLLSVLSAVFALSLLGLFSGLIGYVFEKFSVVYHESKPIIFRDRSVIGAGWCWPRTTRTR